MHFPDSKKKTVGCVDSAMLTLQLTLLLSCKLTSLQTLANKKGVAVFLGSNLKETFTRFLSPITFFTIKSAFWWFISIFENLPINLEAIARTNNEFFVLVAHHFVYIRITDCAFEGKAVKHVSLFLFL